MQMWDRPPGLSAAEVRGAGRWIKVPRSMNNDANRRGCFRRRGFLGNFTATAKKP